MLKRPRIIQVRKLKTILHINVKFKFETDQFSRFKMAAISIIADFTFLCYYILLSQVDSNKIGLYVSINNMKVELFFKKKVKIVDLIVSSEIYSFSRFCVKAIIRRG